MKKRKVKFNRRIRGIAFEKNFPNDGLFHKWAGAYEEFESGAGNYTIALVELEDGLVEKVLPQNIKFEK